MSPEDARTPAVTTSVSLGTSGMSDVEIRDGEDDEVRPPLAGDEIGHAVEHRS